MLQKTMEYMRQQKIELAGEKIVIGLSGGMDSVCLFHVLRELGCELIAVHVNHCIRGVEADKDEAFAKELCETHGVPFYGYRIDVPKLAKEGREKYQKLYGPLLQTDFTPDDGYAWLKDPWPWDVGGNS